MGDSGYEVVAVLREGRIVSTITSRMFMGSPRFSYSIIKEYEQSGTVKQSRWMEVSQLEDLFRVLEKTRAWIDAAVAKHKREREA